MEFKFLQIHFLHIQINITYTNSQLKSFQNDIEDGVYGPSCVVIDDYSRQYNCHGYAWSSSTGTMEIGIDNENYHGVDAYITGEDASYIQTTYNGNQGRLRVLYSGDHSAVTTSYSGLYLSKWGAGPLVRHNANDVPYIYGSPRTYWGCYYSPPLYAVYLDGVQTQNTSVFPVTWGTHDLSISYGLNPETPPYFETTSPSVVVNYQNSTTYNNNVNFTFGTLTHGGMSVSMCQKYVYSFTFYKPSSLQVLIYPNPASSETTVKSIEDINNNYEDIESFNRMSNVKMVKLEMFDDQGRMVNDYSKFIDEGKVMIEIDNNFNGIYYIIATFSNGEKQTKRLLIEK